MTAVSAGVASTRTVRTFCRVCHAACPMEIDLVGDEVVAARGVVDDPLFEGYTCIKGRQYPALYASRQRLHAPLRRRPDGTFEVCESTTVLDEIAARLRSILDAHGPRAIASYTGTGGYQNSLAVPVARAFHQAIGSPSFYTSVTIDQPAKATAPLRIGVWEAGYHNFRDADVIMAIGYNPIVSSYGAVGGLQGTNPVVALRRRKAAGMRLIVVDPRRTELARFADVHLAVRPGEDAALLAGIIHVILAEDLHDGDFCDRWVSQLDELRAAVEPFTPAAVSARCEVPIDDLVTAARLFAAGPRGTAGTGTGPNMAPRSSLTEHLTLVLNTICGRVNREGDRIESGWFLYPDTPKRAQVIPPRHPVNGPPARVRGLRGYRGEMPTTTLAEEILTPGEGQVRALIVNGGNPVVAWPDQALTLEALRALELLVVIDWRTTPTTEQAHYVVASTLSLERADVPHLMDRWFAAPYTNYTPAVVERRGDVLNEWEVFWELAARLGVALPLPGGAAPSDRRPSDDEMLDLAYAGSRMPLDEVRAHRGRVHWDRAMVVGPADASCTARFTVAPPDVVAELAEVATESTSASTFARTDNSFDPAEFPYRLVSRRLKHVLNSLGPELPALAAKGTTNPAYVHPDDLAELGVADGELIEITSPRASLWAQAVAADDVRRGVVSMAHSWGSASLTDEKVLDIGAPTNRLVAVDAAFDPITGMVVQSAIPVRVRRLDHAQP